MEKISGVFQPGDNESTTRRRADVPPGVSTTRLQGQTQGEEEGEGEGKGESKTMLQGAQETVAKALGGGPRGGYSCSLSLFFLFSSLGYCWTCVFCCLMPDN